MSNRIYLNNNELKNPKINIENRYNKKSSSKNYTREYYNKNNYNKNILKLQQSNLNNNRYKNKRKKRAYKFLIFRFIVLIFIIILILTFLFKLNSNNYIKDYNSIIPSLEVNTNQSEYNNNLIKLYFSNDIIINSSDKIIPLYISNSWKNNFPISIEIFSENNISIYKSGSIMPNQYLKEIPMIDNLHIGKNKIIIHIYSYDINNKNIIGTIKKMINIEVKN